MNEPKKDVRVIRPNTGKEAEKPLRVGAYCRVSTGSDEQADSFIAQVRYYTDFIRHSDNMVLVDIYADEGITGTSASKRPEFQRMLKDSEKGKLDRIYVKSVSRFARNSLECIENIRLLQSNGTAVFFENDNIDTEKMNSELILYIKSAFAQSEALAGSRRVSTAVRMQMEHGEYLTPSVPFGYRMKDHTLVPDPDEAAVVRQIYELYRSGVGLGSIVRNLNKNNICNIRWEQTHVRYILSNERYIGDSLLQKYYTPCELPLRKRKNHGEVDKYYVSNTHEAIIDRTLFNEVQARFHAHHKVYEQSAEPVSRLFTGILFCCDCGRRYKVRHNGKGALTWICSFNGNAGQRCCTHPVAEFRLEQTFLMLFNRLQQHKDLLVNQTIARLEAIKRQCVANNSVISDIDHEIAALCEKNELYIRLKSKGIMDEISFEEQSGTVQKRIAELRSRRRKLLAADDDEQLIEGFRELKAILDTAPEAMLSFDPDLFRSIIKRITVKPESLVFEFHCGMRLEELLWS